MSERLLLVGVSHRTAPIGLRDRLARTADNVCVDGAHVLLSTCNRLELYVAVPDADDARRRLVAGLARAARVSERELSAVVTTATEERAVLHLCRVAAGLDSPILGEPQILAQVRSAAAASGAGPLLSRLFASAVRAGRRARNETALGERPGSLALATVALVEERVHDLAGRRVLVVGAGAIGELVAASFRSREFDVVVTSRTHGRAAALASRIGGRAAPIETLSAELAHADVLVSCTRSPRVVVTARELAAARADVRGPLVVVDLALPRDVDPAVAALSGCSLYDLDELNRRACAETRRTDADLAAAEAIAAEEAERFCAWRRSRVAAPAIASLRSRAEAIRAAELARMQAMLETLEPRERRAVETVTTQIVNKLLHAPTVRVKEDPSAQLLPALLRLFALEEAA